MNTLTSRQPYTDHKGADRPPADRWAVAALVLAISSFVVLPLLPSLAALLVGLRAKRRLNDADDAVPGRGLLRAAMVIAAANVVVMVAVIAIATSTSNTLRAKGERIVRVQSLGVGQCFDLDPGRNVLTATVVPCARPHTYEAYATFEDPAPRDAAWPGDASAAEMAFGRCLVRFPAFVGRPYESSSLAMLRLEPNERSWTDNGDRRLLCAVFARRSQLLTGTARSTAR